MRPLYVALYRSLDRAPGQRPKHQAIAGEKRHDRARPDRQHVGTQVVDAQQRRVGGREPHVGGDRQRARHQVEPRQPPPAAGDARPAVPLSPRPALVPEEVVEDRRLHRERRRDRPIDAEQPGQRRQRQQLHGCAHRADGVEDAPPPGQAAGFRGPRARFCVAHVVSRPEVEAAGCGAVSPRATGECAGERESGVTAAGGRPVSCRRQGYAGVVGAARRNCLLRARSWRWYRRSRWRSRRSSPGHRASGCR